MVFSWAALMYILPFFALGTGSARFSTAPIWETRFGNSGGCLLKQICLPVLLLDASLLSLAE
jgi:hypothetical protein